MPPKKTSNNEPDPPDSRTSSPTTGPHTRRNARRPTQEEIETLPNKVMDTKSAECYLQDKLLSIQNQPFTLTHITSILFHITQMTTGIPLPVTTAIRAVAFVLKRHIACEIAEAAAEHLSDSISPKVTDQILATLTPQIDKIRKLSATLNSTILEAETLRKNIQYEREEKENNFQTTAERIEEATNTLYESVDECKNAMNNLQPVLTATQDGMKQLAIAPTSPTNAGPRPTYSSIVAAQLPPAVDQAVARAAI